jgi:hypothetical protein
MKKLKNIPDLMFRLADKNLSLVALTKEHYEIIAIKQLTLNPSASIYIVLEQKPQFKDGLEILNYQLIMNRTKLNFN